MPAVYREICPQYWVCKMLTIIQAQSYEPFFVYRDGIYRYPLTIGQISRVMAKWTKNAGLDSNLYTPHALRRGGLSWAHQARVSREALHILGDWGSSAYLRYIDIDFESKVQSGKQMAELAGENVKNVKKVHHQDK